MSAGVLVVDADVDPVHTRGDAGQEGHRSHHGHVDALALRGGDHGRSRRELHEGRREAGLFVQLQAARAEQQPFSLKVNGHVASMENLYRMTVLRPEELDRHGRPVDATVDDLVS